MPPAALAFRRMSQAAAMGLAVAGSSLLMPATRALDAGSGDPAADTVILDFEAAIEALVSANPPPTLVDGGRRRRAIFPETFDWKENDRVWKALKRLEANKGDALWSHLAKRSLKDTRYVLTYCDDNKAHNATVGWLCHEMWRADLYRAYLQHAPAIAHDPALGRQPSPWVPDFPEGIVQWCERRKGKKLHELQIELCQWAVEKAPGLSRLSDAQRTKFVTEVNAEIEKLRRTHEPVVARQFYGDSFEKLGEKEAAATRQRLQNGS